MRNRLIGVGVSVAILVLALIFFHDAGEGPWSAIGMAAFASTLVVAHTLDALERRRERRR